MIPIIEFHDGRFNRGAAAPSTTEVTQD